MRVAHNMLFDSYIRQLNQSTTKLQNLSQQASTQKKVNRPADNPVGMSRILNYRDSISALQKFQDNISGANNKLGLTDKTLQQTQDMLTRSKELAVQAANETYSKENRESISKELHQIFDQVLAQANTMYEGQSIFAGHKVQDQAYTRGLAVSSNKTQETSLGHEMDLVTPYVQDIEGESNNSIRVEFSDSGTIGQDDIDYRYSTDGGDSYTDKTMSSGDTDLDLGEVTLRMHEGFKVDGDTELELYPTAIYQGDDQNKPGVEILNKFDTLVEPQQGSFDSEVQVRVTDVDGGDVEYEYSLDQGEKWSDKLYTNVSAGEATLHLPGGEVRLEELSGSSTDLEDLEFTLGGTHVQQLNTENLQTVAVGDFTDKVLVRVDEDVDLENDAEIKYSYSTDQGRSWEEGNTAENPTAQDEYAELVVPGGKLKLTHTTEKDIQAGDQFSIQPRQAGIDTEISQGVRLQQNLLGPEVFGGHYKNPEGLEPAFESEPQKNLFLGLGKLITALEQNDREGIQAGLQHVDGAIEQVSNMQASTGARLNRLESTEKVLSDLEMSEKERKGNIEDVDFAELMSQLTQQRTIYQAVLKSSSMIMRMSLVDYI
ncbi:MAG: flagellar hook-associated protein FlgL [Desulfohalobiaceae bacterium]